MSRYSSLRMLAGLCLLIGQAAPSHTQSASPMPVDEGHPTTPIPQQFSATPPTQVDSAPAEPAHSTLFEPARPLSPWYVDAEKAVLFTAAVHLNEKVGVIEDHHVVFVSPRVFLGHRFEGGSSVRFTYRNLTEVGRLDRQDSSSPSDGSTTTSFTTNWFDLDYVSPEYAPLDWWRFQWEVGGRFVFRYIGSCYESPDVYYENRNTYFGGGPHLGLTSHWLLGPSGWALFGRADTAVTFGGGASEYRYGSQHPYPGGYAPSSYSDRTSTQEMQFDLNLQMGLMKRWQLEGCAVGLGFGVQGEVLSIGNLKDTDHNTFGLVNVGPFLRCEIGF